MHVLASCLSQARSRQDGILVKTFPFSENAVLVGTSKNGG